MELFDRIRREYEFECDVTLELSRRASSTAQSSALSSAFMTRSARTLPGDNQSGAASRAGKQSQLNRFLGRRSSGSPTLVTMMETTDLWDRKNRTASGAYTARGSGKSFCSAK
jgi:hypothetical protein